MKYSSVLPLGLLDESASCIAISDAGNPKIKKPSPTAFFADLLPGDADAFLRQAMVMCWMMMSRSGGRKVSEVRKIVGDIYRRNIDAWDQDEKALAGPSRKRPSRKTPTRTSSKPKPKKTRGRAKK